MVTELLKQDGRVAGAIGFAIEGNEPVVVKAKATVMCAGGGSFRPIGYPVHELTADGQVMAYRVGAVITGKEYVSPHSTNPEQPAWPPMYLFFSSGGSAALPGMWQDPKLFNAEGCPVAARGMAWHGWLDAEYEAHEGRAPLVADLGRRGIQPVSGPGAHGSMLGHAAGGICPVRRRLRHPCPRTVRRRRQLWHLLHRRLLLRVRLRNHARRRHRRPGGSGRGEGG